MARPPAASTCARSAAFRPSKDSIAGSSLSVSTRSQIESPIVERSSASESWPRSIESCRRPVATSSSSKASRCSSAATSVTCSTKSRPSDGRRSSPWAVTASEKAVPSMGELSTQSGASNRLPRFRLAPSKVRSPLLSAPKWASPVATGKVLRDPVESQKLPVRG